MRRGTFYCLLTIVFHCILTPFALARSDGFAFSSPAYAACSGVHGMCFAPCSIWDNPCLLATADSSSVILWDAAHGAAVWRSHRHAATLDMKGYMSTVSFTPDGQKLAALFGGTIYTWELKPSRRNKPVLLYSCGKGIGLMPEPWHGGSAFKAPCPPLFSPDGSLLAVLEVGLSVSTLRPYTMEIYRPYEGCLRQPHAGSLDDLCCNSLSVDGNADGYGNFSLRYARGKTPASSSIV